MVSSPARWRSLGIALLFGIVGVLAVALMSPASPTLAATYGSWNVYPGFYTPGTWDYGWHFDEGSPQWGARDYNYSGDAGGNVVFYAKLTQNASYPVRWRFDSSVNCHVHVIAQANLNGTWYDISGTEMHYVHLVDRVASGTVTGQVSSNGQGVLAFLGHAGTCNTNATHAHHSADMTSSSRTFRVWYNNDTCWSDNPNGYVYQCNTPLFTFRKDDGVSSCPPGAWSGYAYSSGPYARYVCQEWSQQARDYTQPAFTVNWN
jgi:hypothetical protein